MPKHTSEAKNKDPIFYRILPVPPQVIQHHGQNENGLFGPMRQWAQQKHIPPVLLITGASGVGKRTLAYFLSQWILCEKTGLNLKTYGEAEENGTIDLFGGPSPNTNSAPPSPSLLDSNPIPCGACPSCERAMHGNWVDFLEIHPEDQESDTLKIDQFRDLKSKTCFGAHEGNYRIILIPNADRMTLQAANSMLKLLEEPPAGWIFLLTSSDPSLLLPTIVSRCQTLRLKPFSSPELTELLSSSGISAERALICSELAQGSWGKAWELAQDESWNHRKALFDFLQDPPGMLNSILDWATSDPKNFSFLVNQMEILTFDLIRWSMELDTNTPNTYCWINRDGATALTSHARVTVKALGSPEKARNLWLERAERLARVRQEALAPLNRKILAQDLLLPWLKAST